MTVADWVYQQQWNRWVQPNTSTAILDEDMPDELKPLPLTMHGSHHRRML